MVGTHHVPTIIYHHVPNWKKQRVKLLKCGMTRRVHVSVWRIQRLFENVRDNLMCSMWTPVNVSCNVQRMLPHRKSVPYLEWNGENVLVMTFHSLHHRLQMITAVGLILVCFLHVFSLLLFIRFHLISFMGMCSTTRPGNVGWSLLVET